MLNNENNHLLITEMGIVQSKSMPVIASVNSDIKSELSSVKSTKSSFFVYSENTSRNSSPCIGFDVDEDVIIDNLPSLEPLDRENGNVDKEKLTENNNVTRYVNSKLIDSESEPFFVYESLNNGYISSITPPNTNYVEQEPQHSDIPQEKESKSETLVESQDFEGNSSDIEPEIFTDVDSIQNDNREIVHCTVDKPSDTNHQVCEPSVELNPTKDEKTSESALIQDKSKIKQTEDTNNKLADYNYTEPNITVHFSDFKLDHKLRYKKKILINDMYCSEERVSEILYSYINHIIKISSESDNPLIVTVAIQLFIMFFEAYKTVNLNIIECIGILSIRYSFQLEYDNSPYENLRSVSRKFRKSFDNLLEIEKQLILSFKGFYFDNCYYRLTVSERSELLNNVDLRNKFYKFLSDPDIYVNSSKEIADLWRSYNLQH